MAGHVRFESSSASPEELGFTGNRPNGQRASYPSSALDRSGSFREGSESRGFNSGATTPRSTASSHGDVVPITHYLVLDHIAMDYPKYTRSGELRQALGISLGNATEDNSFGTTYSKPLPPAATEELKRFKASIIDTAFKARGRVKKFNDSLLRLNKFSELRKQQRNEIITNERSNVLKTGQLHRNPLDIGAQRSEDRSKNIVLNKRVRSSVAELRADGRGNILPKQNLMGKDRELLKDGGDGSDMAEEKVRRLPAVGEGWDRKMKRKRSVGTVFIRSTDSEGEAKRSMHHKLSNDADLQSYDNQGLRSGSFNGTSVAAKVDIVSSPASANSILKNESEKVSLMKDFAPGMNKERPIAKSNKLSSLEDHHIVNPSPVTKGKASRTPRSGSVTTSISSPNFSRTSGVLDVPEQASNINKVNSVGGPNNRKRPLPTGPSSPSMAQWVGQRPQKISRTRRANVVSPVSNHDDLQISSEGGHFSDLGARVTSVGAVINGSPLAKDVVNGNQHVKAKNENVPSPARLSESEESGAGENRDSRPKDKGIGNGMEEKSPNQNVVPSVLLTKKNKVLNREDTSDGVRRQGRTGRGASSSRPSISLLGEKFENPPSVKPIKSTRIISENNGSKSGRPPLKKLSDRKSLIRLGQTAAGSSPDFTGESDDDHEELLEAANFACNVNHLSCSGQFWKKMEPVFAPVQLGVSSYLEQELKSSEELHDSLSEMFVLESNNLKNLLLEGDCSKILSEESKRSLHGQALLKTSVDLVDQEQYNDAPSRSTERENKSTPLYQRVLSALIVEDESEEFDENGGEENISFYYDRSGSPGDSYHCIDFELGNKNGMKFDCDSTLGCPNQKQSFVSGFPCNGSATLTTTTGFGNELCNDELFQGGHGIVHPKIGVFLGDSKHNGAKTAMPKNASAISVLDSQYEQMCLEDKLLMELQSVGLYPETVPDLADGEDDAITQDIIKLQKQLHQLVGKKKNYLGTLVKAIQDGREIEERAIEQVAMSRVVEVAYKKLLATRGNIASKLGLPKVSKQVAMAFIKRTLVRCRKFEAGGKSCFSEPTLRDILVSAPAYGNDAEVNSNVHPRILNSMKDPSTPGSFLGRSEQHDLDRFGSGYFEAFAAPPPSSDHDFAKTGPILNRGKKKELLLDDVGNNAAFRAMPSHGDSPLGGAKGKRSERERDKDTSVRNSAKRAYQNNAKGDRKMKSKPKQKTAQLSTAGDGTINKFKESNSNQKREVGGVTPHGRNPQDSSKEGKETADIADLQELELGIGNEFGGNQDLNSWFNFDVDGDLGGELPMDGLEIPMDDILEVFR